MHTSARKICAPQARARQASNPMTITRSSAATIVRRCSGRCIRLGRTSEAHLAEQIIDLGPRDAEVNEHLRRGTAFLVEQTEKHMLGTDKWVAEIFRGRICECECCLRSRCVGTLVHR